MREYDPIVGRWTAVDPKRVGFSPYLGVENNGINLFDSDGGEANPIYDTNGNKLGFDSAGDTGVPIILTDAVDFTDGMNHNVVMDMVNNGKAFEFGTSLVFDQRISPEVFTSIINQTIDGVGLPEKNANLDLSRLPNRSISLALSKNGKVYSVNGGEPGGKSIGTRHIDGDRKFMITLRQLNRDMTLTVENMRSMFGVHEYYGHGLKCLPHSDIYKLLSETYQGTTVQYQNFVNEKIKSGNYD